MSFLITGRYMCVCKFFVLQFIICEKFLFILYIYVQFDNFIVWEYYLSLFIWICEINEISRFNVIVCNYYFLYYFERFWYDFYFSLLYLRRRINLFCSVYIEEL